MHEVRTIATDFPGVCKSVNMSGSLYVTRLLCAKTAERIKILFGVKTLGVLRNIVLDGGLDCPTAKGNYWYWPL